MDQDAENESLRKPVAEMRLEKPGGPGFKSPRARQQQGYFELKPLLFLFE